MQDMADELLKDERFQGVSFENYTLWKQNITEILKEIERKAYEEQHK